jgi:hypothetical protein
MYKELYEEIVSQYEPNYYETNIVEFPDPSALRNNWTIVDKHTHDEEEVGPIKIILFISLYDGTSLYDPDYRQFIYDVIANFIDKNSVSVESLLWLISQINRRGRRIKSTYDISTYFIFKFVNEDVLSSMKDEQIIKLANFLIRFGTSDTLKLYVVSHLPPSFRLASKMSISDSKWVSLFTESV